MVLHMSVFHVTSGALTDSIQCNSIHAAGEIKNIILLHCNLVLVALSSLTPVMAWLVRGLKSPNVNYNTYMLPVSRVEQLAVWSFLHLPLCQKMCFILFVSHSKHPILLKWIWWVKVEGITQAEYKVR